MKILGIETSTGICSVAVTDGKKIRDEISLNTGLVHSEKLIPLVDKILRRNSLSVKKIRGIAVSIGPGSFTGIRIGVTTARTFAQSLNIPLVGICGLDGLSNRVSIGTDKKDTLICPIINALRKEVYTGLYSKTANRVKRLTGYKLIKIEDLLNSLKKKKRNVFFLGEAVDLYAGLIKKYFDKKAMIAEVSERYASALSIAFLGLEKTLNGYSKPYTEVLPMYIRKPSAELKRKETAEKERK